MKGHEGKINIIMYKGENVTQTQTTKGKNLKLLAFVFLYFLYQLLNFKHFHP